MFEMWMDIGGFCQEEFKMYMENPWRAPAIHPSTELNFVKPPMVDREGVIMCPNDVNMFGVPSKFHNYRAQGRYSTIADYGVADIASTITGINKDAVCGKATSATGQHPLASNMDDSYRNFQHTWIPTTNSTDIWSGAVASGNIRASTWTNCIDNTYVTWPSTIRPVPKSLMQDKNKLNDQGIKKYRLQDYFLFLSNVKNIPIGVAPKKSILINNQALVGELNGADDNAIVSYDTLIGNWNFATIDSIVTSFSSSQTFTVALPIFSGLIGVWAEKAFPTMLIAPGSFYLQLRFAKIAQAFQFTMDPCRRIFGTYRDYVPNIGLINGYCTDYAGQIIDNGRVKYMDNLGNGTNTYLALTDHGANGTDFAYKGYSIIPKTTDGGLCSLGTDSSIINSYLSENIYALSEYDHTDSTYNAKSCVLTALNEKDGIVTGVPKPQYVPVNTPWVYGQRFTSLLKPGIKTEYCEETSACFGTYLPASTAQVRRTTTYSNAKIANLDSSNLGTANQPRVEILIQNLMYVGQQIILPDEVTASIVRMAVNGDISILSHSCKTYRTTLNSASSQNLILPIKIASANALFVLFQNVTMLENSHYASCTRNCPFTSFQWTSNGYTPLSNKDKDELPYFVGSDIPPKVSSVGTITPFSIQLRLGNEMLPIQPITNMHMLTQELQRAVHAANDMIRNFRSIADSDTPSAT